MKKLLSILLALLFIVSLVALPVTAATKINAYSKLSASVPARTYTIKSSGRCVPYTTKELTTRGTTNGAQSGAYIENSTDEIYIFSVGKNSKGVMYAYVSYPGTYNRVYAYMRLSDLVSSTSTSHTCTTATGKFYLALRSGSSLNSSYWVDKGDPVYLLSTTATNGKYQIMAPRGAGGYRIAWCTVSDYNKYCKETTSVIKRPATSITLNYSSTSTLKLSGSGKTYTLKATLTPYNTTDTVTWSSSNTNVATVSSSGVVTAVGNGTAMISAKTTSGRLASVKVQCANCDTFSPVWPCKTATYITTMYRYYNNGKPKNHGVRSNIYNAFDVTGNFGDSILAIEKGVVVEKGFQPNGFGYYVVIEHSNGLRSLYGHMKQSAEVEKNQTVYRGEVIGYMGYSGNCEPKDINGTHLHFELYNPNNKSKVINPWTTYYQGKVSVTIGGRSYLANINYKNDTYAQAWCKWLKNSCVKNDAGNYVFKK